MNIETHQMEFTANMEGKVKHSDTRIEMKDPYGDVKLRLTREEVQNLVEEMPAWWWLDQEE